MTEKQLLGHVVALARTKGWKCAHFHTVRAIVGGRKQWMTPVAADGKGFPDLLLVRERVLAVEVKGGSHKPTVEQDAWLMAFRLAGVRVAVFTPRDLDNGAIEAELTERVPYRSIEPSELFVAV